MTDSPGTNRTLRTAIAQALAEANQHELSLLDTATVLTELVAGWVEQIDVERTADSVLMASCVSAKSGDPFVQFTVGPERWQWTPEVAREHARKIFETAEAAAHDAAMLRWLRVGTLGLDSATAVQALLDLRRFRGDSTA